MGFKKGEGGRPRGAVNKATREIKDAARKLLEDKAYQLALKRRLKAGKAPHMETLLHYYAYGKPRETLAVQGDIPPFVLMVRQDDGLPDDEATPDGPDTIQ